MSNIKEDGGNLRAIAVVVVALGEVDGLERKLETPPPELEDRILKAAKDAFVSLLAQAPAARLERKLETPPPELEDRILKAAKDAFVSLLAQAPAARLEMKRLEEK